MSDAHLVNPKKEFYMQNCRIKKKKKTTNLSPTTFFPLQIVTFPHADCMLTQPYESVLIGYCGHISVHGRTKILGALPEAGAQVEESFQH